MIVIALVVLVGAVLPEAEYPWPERIGVGFPFISAGALSISAGAWPGLKTLAGRDRAARIGSFVGFWLGSFIYLCLLAVRVASEI